MTEEYLAKPFNTNAIHVLYTVSDYQTYTYLPPLHGWNIADTDSNSIQSYTCFYHLFLVLLFYSILNPKPLYHRPPTLNTCTYINKFVRLQFIFLQFWISTFNFRYPLTLSLSVTVSIPFLLSNIQGSSNPLFIFIQLACSEPSRVEDFIEIKRIHLMINMTTSKPNNQ